MFVHQKSLEQFTVATCAACLLAVDIFDSLVRVTFILILEAVVDDLVVLTIAA